MLLASIALAAGVQTSMPASPGATLIDRTRSDRARPATPRRRPAPPAPAAIAVPADAPDTTIVGIRFLGAAAPAPVAKAGRTFLGRKASKQTLGELAAALSAAYAKSDIALYTIAIPAQDFAGGVVDVQLIEGRIADVDFGAAAGPQLRGRLTPLVEERPLSRATFERQLTLARAIPGLTLTTDLTDPEGNGALRLKATPRQKRTKLTAGYTSRGVDLLGAGQLNATLDAYGALVDGDQISAALSAAPDLKRYRLATAGYSAPIGTRGLTAGVSAAYLETRPRGRIGKGTAKQVAATLSYPLIRSFTRSADVALSVDGIDSADATIASVVARERSRAVRLAGSYAKGGAKRSWSAAVAASRGLGVLGARSPESDTRFNKITANAAVGQALGKRVTVRASVSGQWSADRLPAAERFAIGGEAIGRAFDEAFIAGDSGRGGSVELAWRPVADGKFGQSELYGFADQGRVKIKARGTLPTQRYSLGSAGVGGRLRYGEKAELGLEAARVIDRPFPTYRDDWALTASWRLSL